MTVEGNTGGTAIGRRSWHWAGGAAILAVLVWEVGAGPFVDGLGLTTAWGLAGAAAITSLTTLCCAWRWSLVADGLGVDVRLRPAVGHYYRSQFLNLALPGGVLGDVHRGLRHGHAVGDQGMALRSVAWERASGQLVQIVLTMLALLLLAPPEGALAVAVACAVMAVALALVLRRTGRATRAPAELRLPSRIARAMSDDLRGAVLTRRALPGIVLASALALIGHVAVFAIALQATGAALPVDRLLPLALIVLLAAAVPTNIAGWGPREGAAAWAFASAGLGAAAGVTVAVVYGVLALAAALPGAVLLVADRRRAAPADPRARARAGGVAHV